jgi:acetylornithine deacetylase
LQTFEIFERLVGFPTVSPASNLELIAFVDGFLRDVGFSMRRFPDSEGRKEALFASRGPRDVPGILLSAHSDFVPVDGQIWTSDPFRLAARDGRLYGRGTADMKGYLASMLSAAARTSRHSLSAPLHLAVSYDEEIGCVGVRPMLDELAKQGLRPRLCLIGEPTEMRVATGHKGKISLRAVCRGTTAHSSTAPLALNALHLAADFLASIRRIQSEIVAKGRCDADYDVPYTTLHAGVLQGGTALNIVPDRAVLDFEIRYLAEDDPDAILATLARDAAAIIAPHLDRFPEAAIDVEIRNRYPGLGMAADTAEIAGLQGLLGRAETIKVAFGTEAGLFHERLGVPALVCGPGSIEQAHKADEYIERSEIECCDAFLDRLIASVSQ